jgi:rhodanese-related sulfurtransferase
VLLKENGARLIDVREPWEFATARIEGGVPIPMGEVASRAHQELDPEERLVVLCHHGIRSMNVTVWLRNQGFEQAQSLRGGIDAWSVEVDPKVVRY